jgi:succinate dehydrogenase hydrophobic anchor subunit
MKADVKDRLLKQRITSVIGVLLMCFGLYVAYMMFDKETLKTMPILDLVARVGFVGAILVLGYVFLMAKDSLLTGLFWGAFKTGVKPK